MSVLSLLFGVKHRRRTTCRRRPKPKPTCARRRSSKRVGGGTNCRLHRNWTKKTCVNRKLKRTTKSHCRSFVDAAGCGGDPSCNWSDVRGCISRRGYRTTKGGYRRALAYQGPMGKPIGWSEPVESAPVAIEEAAVVAPVSNQNNALAVLEAATEFGRNADCRRRRNRSKAVCKRKRRGSGCTRRRATKRRSTGHRATRSKNVSHCRALADAAACGGDPSCNWTARGCVGRRSYKTTQAGYHKALTYQGPMGRPAGFTEFGKRRKVHRRKAHRKGRKVHHKKPAKALLRKCRKMGIKVTMKRGGKRVYKKTSVLKKALNKKIRMMKKRSHHRR